MPYVDVRVNVCFISRMPDTMTLSAAETRTYSISELAREFGVTPRALRFYEDKDMLHPSRDGMARVYSYRDRGRLKLIVHMKSLGLALNDIREILDLYALGDGQRAQTRASLEKFRNQIVELEKQRIDIDEALVELRKGVGWLEERLEKIGPAEEDAEKVRAYEQTARERLND